MELDDEAKKVDRAKRFGADEALLVKGLDSALPERKPKRGREGGGDGERGAKRQGTDGRQGGQGGRGRERRGGGGGGGDRGNRGDNRRGDGRQSGGAPKRSGNILTDPNEKAKAEARAKRFGA